MGDENASDEDIPSDFFDDFVKDDFISGLSVVDSWNDDDTRKKQIKIEDLEKVDDLRELLREDKVMKSRKFPKYDKSKYTYVRKRESAQEDVKSSECKSENNLNKYIKPGSRRDPSKTQEAIKKDKEEKVKNYLAKHLDSSDDLKPPGTELDDFFDSKAGVKKDKSVHEEKKVHEDIKKKRSQKNSEILRSKYSRHSPRNRGRQSPKRSPIRNPRRSPLRRSPLRRSPLRRSPLRRRSPHRSPHWSPRHSPVRPRRFGYDRRSPQHHSPRRNSPQLSPHRARHSRSPKRSHYRPRHSRSRSPNKINFMFPAQAQSSFSGESYPNVPLPLYSEPAANSFVAGTPGYSYTPDVPYSGVYSGSYEYGIQGIPPDANIAPASFTPQPVPVPQPVAAPVIQPLMDIAVTNLVSQPIVKPENTVATSNNDALAKLVAEGKLSQEDYMKLAPNKNAHTPMDTKTRVAVLNRCYTAMTKLKKLALPNQLIINNIIVGHEQKCIEPKYCSPLKRQARVEFELTKPGDISTQQNKQLVDSIITSIGLDKIVVRPKKKTQKNLKDAATQTSRPFCDMCEIRDSMKLYDASTNIDFEHFNKTVHTQVVEQDLVSSKSLFNPSGSIGDTGPISIAHMTPAQLVSQLAARAKTLKQSEPAPASSGNVYGRRNLPNSYESRGGNSYNNYNNYRY